MTSVNVRPSQPEGLEGGSGMQFRFVLLVIKYLNLVILVVNIDHISPGYDINLQFPHDVKR